MSKTELYSHKNLENTGLFAQLAPHQYDAFNKFAFNCFEPGALSLTEKELIAVCCAHTLKCAYCIDYHVRLAKKANASDKQISDAAWLGASSAALNTFTALKQRVVGWRRNLIQPKQIIMRFIKRNTTHTKYFCAIAASIVQTKN